MKRSTFVLLLLLAAPACVGLGAGDALDPLPVAPSAADARNDLRVEVGTGTSAYERIADGAVVDVVPGPQGGYHIWTSVLVHDPSLALVRIELSTRFTDDGRPAGAPSSFATSLIAVGGAREHAGMTSFVTSPDAVQGRRVVLRAEVFAQDGRHGTGERTVLIR